MNDATVLTQRLQVKEGMEAELGDAEQRTRDKVSALQTQLDSTKAELNEAALRLQRQEQALASVEAGHGEQLAELLRLEEAVQALTVQRDRLQEELSDATEDNEQQIDRLKSIIDDQETELSAAKDAANSADSKVKSLTAALKEAVSSMQNLQAETDAHEDEVQAKVTELSAQLAEAIIAKEQLQKELSKQSGSVTDSELTEWKEKCFALQARVDQECSRVTKLTEDIQELSTTNTNLKAACNQLKEEVSNLQAADDGNFKHGGHIDGGIVDLSAFYATKSENDLLRKEIERLRLGKANGAMLPAPSGHVLPDTSAPTADLAETPKRQVEQTAATQRSVLKSVNTPITPVASKKPVQCTLKIAPETPSARLREQLPGVTFGRKTMMTKQSSGVSSSQGLVKRPSVPTLSKATNPVNASGEDDEPGECATQ